MREYIFTFGYGQRHPVSDGSVAEMFVSIFADDGDAARAEMIRRFGLAWYNQYSAHEKDGRMTELRGLPALGRLPLEVARNVGASCARAAAEPIEHGAEPGALEPTKEDEKSFIRALAARFNEHMEPHEGICRDLVRAFIESYRHAMQSAMGEKGVRRG